MDEPYPSPPILAPGTLVAGKYVLGEVLGLGGSAVVYEANQLGLGRSVAFKVYPIREGTDPTFVTRFQREARLMARVHHENVIAVFDNGVMDDGSPFLVVQRVRGESLAQRLQSGPLPVSEVIDLAQQLLRALGALHQAGITHRDIKPENLMFDHSAGDHSVLKLVDFGIAVPQDNCDDHPLDQTGELIGTPRYMSPEQMRGDAVDVRSDLYALGATCYEALTGRTPHGGQSLDEIAAATFYEPITAIRTLREDCPEVLERILLKALSRERECRYESPSEMGKELERWSASRHTQDVAAPKPDDYYLAFEILPLSVEPDILEGYSQAEPLALAAPAPEVPITLPRRRHTGRRLVRTMAVATAACVVGLLGLFALKRPLPLDHPTGIFQSAQKLFTAPGPSRSEVLLLRLCPSFLCPGETNEALSTALDS